MAMNTGAGGGYNSDINVTPLVDVMLVLLVVFMITAPMLQTGVDLNLPETKTQQIEDAEGKLILSINAQGKLFLGATPVKWAELVEKLATNEKVKKDSELFIEADASLPYSVVVTAMAASQEAGVAKLQMLTDSSQDLDLASLDQGLPKSGPAKSP